MYRIAIEKLIKWKESKRRKQVIIEGARQVGKTWLMNELGSSCYEKTFYFNFDKEESLKDIFKNNKNPTRFLELLGILKEDKILPGKHLIIFDENCKMLQFRQPLSHVVPFLVGYKMYFSGFWPAIFSWM